MEIGLARAIRRVGVLLCCCALVAGCGDANSRVRRTPGSVHLDTIWRLTSEELNRVGGAVLHDGSLFVANVGNSQVLAIDLKTENVSTIGRAGRGPGEFLSITDVVVGDSLVYILDALGSRVLRFVLGAVPQFDSLWALPPEMGAAEQIATDGQGRLFVSFLKSTASTGNVSTMVVWRDSVRVVELDRSGAEGHRVVATFPGNEYYYGVTDDGKRWLGVPAFGTGSYYAYVDGGVFVADARTGVVTTHAWSGQSSVVQLALQEQRKMAASDEIAEWLERVNVRAARLPDGEEYRRLANVSLEVWKGAPPLPLFEGIAGGSGVVLIQLYAFGTRDSVEWRVVDARSGTEASTMLPGNLRLMTATGDTVVAVGRDSLGVETILLLQMRKD